MKEISSYIIEKLHLNNSNKDITNIDDPTDFIESFKSVKEKAKITSLISRGVHYVEREAKRGNENHICYVLKEISKFNSNDFEYKWSTNLMEEDLKVGDTDSAGNEILYVVTKNTIIPDKYEKYAEKY